MSEERHPVDVLADEFASRLRGGEQPTIADYEARHPQHAALIRSVFPSIARLEQARSAQSSARSSANALRLSPEPLNIPKVLGDFQLLHELGRGGMGVVYEARQQSLQRRVAIKMMAQPQHDVQRRRERFRREAEAAAGLHHTNIVAIYGTGQDEHCLYYAMQLIEGHSLCRVINNLREHRAQSAVPHNSSSNKSASSNPAKLPADESEHLLATLCRQLGTPFSETYFRNLAELVANAASGLAHAHEHGVLHRDIKPSNLMLDREGTIWITDFGVAKQTQLADMTQAGEIVGTLRYMAPEQMRGESDPRSDLYSLGLVLYELVTLRAAVQLGPDLEQGADLRQDADPRQDARLHSTKPQPTKPQPTKPHSTKPKTGYAATRFSDPLVNALIGQPVRRPLLDCQQLPRDLEVILLKTLAPEPEDRYQTAAQLEEDLRRFAADRPILAKPESAVRKLRRLARRNPAVVGLTAAALGLLVTVAALLAIGNQQQRRALQRIEAEFNRAETNLQEKVAALGQVDAERTRAENNLQMALEAFSQVITNLGARGGTESLLDDLADDETLVMAADAVLSEADVQLLEQLLEFFARFAVTNSADLSAESAAARQRIGDIQRRLGRLDAAVESYQLALESYQQFASENPADSRWLFAQVTVLNELMVVAAERGFGGQVVRLFEQAREILQARPAINDSDEGKFATAKLCNTMTSLGTRPWWQRRAGNLTRPRRVVTRRNANNSARVEATIGDASAANTATGNDNTPAQKITQDRLRREAEANALATSLLHSLLANAPENVSYRLTLSRALREQVRIAEMQGDYAKAEAALQQAIEVAERLCEQFPESNAFLFELAETLRAGGAIRRGDMMRLTRALKISETLMREQPESIDYRSLRSGILSRMAMTQFAGGNLSRAAEAMGRALADQRLIAIRQPDVAVYQMAMVATLTRLVEILNELGEPQQAIAAIDEVLATLRQFQREDSLNNRRMQRLRPLMERLRQRSEELAQQNQLDADNQPELKGQRALQGRPEMK
ncbi:protein kinase domain-containing protein [Planctomycetaceae bacterium SH139]